MIVYACNRLPDTGRLHSLKGVSREISAAGEVCPAGLEESRIASVLLFRHSTEHFGSNPVLGTAEQEREFYAVAAAERAAFRMPVEAVHSRADAAFPEFFQIFLQRGGEDALREDFREGRAERGAVEFLPENLPGIDRGVVTVAAEQHPERRAGLFAEVRCD